MAFRDDLEKKITGKISKIDKGTLTVKDAGLNVLIKRLKELDEATAEELEKKYLATVRRLNAKKESRD